MAGDANRSSRRDVLAADGVLLVATFVWGATFVLVRDALRDVSPLLFVALRFTLATLVLLPWVVARHGLPPASTLRAGCWVGGFLFAGFALQTTGLEHTEPARAAFITGLCVVMVPVLYLLLYRRAPALGSVLGVSLATAGLALLSGIGVGREQAGDLLVLGGAAAFAGQILAVDRFTRRTGATPLLLPEMATVAIVAWPAAFTLEAPRLRLSGAVLLALIVTALLATVFALWAQNFAQQRTTPTRTALIFTLEPVFALLVSYAFTSERFGARETAGAALILGGMLAAELLPRRPQGSGGLPSPP